MEKTKYYLLAFIISITSMTISAQKKRHIEDVLEITGSALLNNQRTSNYSISVYLDGTRIDSMYTKSKKTSNFTQLIIKFTHFYFKKKIV